MNTDKVKVGVLGLGEHGERAHLVHLAKDPRVEIVAGFDLDDEKNGNFEKNYPGAKAVASMSELVKGNIDAVLVMTPDRFHLGSSLAALQAGKHVLCEKPLAEKSVDMGRLEQAIHLASKNKLVYTTCHPRRFDRPFLWLKKNLPDLKAELGEVLDFDFDFSYHAPSKTDLHHGLLIDHVNHEVDLMNFLFGFDKFVANKLNDSQTRYRVTGQRADGIAFSFAGSRMLNERIYPEFLKVRFARGELSLNAHEGISTIYHHESGKVEVKQSGKTDYEGRFTAVNDNFISAIRGEKENYLTPADLRVNTASGIYLTEADTYRV